MAKVYEYWVKLLRELRRSKMLVLWGSIVRIRLPRGEIYIPRSIVPKEAVEA